jgi:hypothetical protein
MPVDPPSWFGDDEIVIDLALNVGEVELAGAVDRCAPLIREFDPAALEFASADPDGGWSGYHVSLIVVSRPPAGGAPDATALRREAGRLASRFGLAAGDLEQVDTAFGPQVAYAGPARSYPDFALVALTAMAGRSARQAYQAGPADEGAERGRRALPVPCGDSDTVFRLHAAVAADDPATALWDCLPLAEQAGATAVEVAPLPGLGGSYLVALLGVGPAVDVPPTDAGLLRAAAATARRLGLADDRLALRHAENWSVAVLPAEPAAGVMTLYVRQGIDPFSPQDATEEAETRPLELRGPGVSDSEVGEIVAELRSAVSRRDGDARP